MTTDSQNTTLHDPCILHAGPHFRKKKRRRKKEEKKVACNLSPVTCHLSPVTCHLSPFTCHLSTDTWQLTPITSHQHQQPQTQTIPIITAPSMHSRLFLLPDGPLAVHDDTEAKFFFYDFAYYNQYEYIGKVVKP